MAGELLLNKKLDIFNWLVATEQVKPEFTLDEFEGIVTIIVEQIVACKVESTLVSYYDGNWITIESVFVKVVAWCVIWNV